LKSSKIPKAIPYEFGLLNQLFERTCVENFQWFETLHKSYKNPPPITPTCFWIC
jgi:hypothetical protein